jgi:uncharacterized protein
MHKVVVDTNVFISGILFGGNPQKTIQAWINQKYIFCLSPTLKAEIIRKLQEKFLLSQDSIKLIEETLETKTKKYIPKYKISICRDPQDNFLLKLAKKANADYLISGDKDVLRIKVFEETKIISPRDFLETLSL